jgi:hypothetical protein
VTVQNIGEYLDQEFDKVGRLRDGSISDAAIERCGFRWAVKRVRAKYGHISEAQAQGLVKAAGWY